MTRANHVTITATAQGYEAKFKRTHKHIATIMSTETAWTPDENANATANRESYRVWVCEHAQEFGIIWNPDKATQAWERKYNTYMTDEQVGEDAITLVTPTIERLVDKSRYNMTLVDIELTGVTAKDSTLGYVTDGKYNKNGAWCVADIELTIGLIINGKAVAVLYNMEMKSGQICKSKTTIAEWNEMVARELDLQGIVIEQEVKTA